MKCPKCQREVEKGSLYCQYCLTEIPWVKEFNSVETLMEKKKKEEAEIPAPVPSGLVRPGWLSRKYVCSALILVLLLGAARGILYRRSHTFQALYQRSEQACQRQEYDQALQDIQSALKQNETDEKGMLLKGKILAAMEDYDSAITVLREAVREHPDSAGACETLMEVYVQAGRTDEVKKFMDACREESLRAALKKYICGDPVLSLGSGVYASRQRVSMSGDCEKIYYTLDGSEPDASSLLYEEPVFIPVGTTELKAIGFNELGIPGNLVTARYVVVTGKPAPPTVTPESGDYDKKIRIELEVPEGCKGYYAFDQEATQESTEYTVPISMPVGYHVFYAVSVSANGESSEPVVRKYYLQY